MTWSTFSAAIGAVTATAIVIIYLTPFIVACLRLARARYWIMLVNLALGFTVVGWIAALIWAFKAPSDYVGPPRWVWPIVATAGFTLLALPAVLFLMADPAREDVTPPAPLFPAPCGHLDSATVNGTIRQLGVVQTEAAETPQFHFRLDLDKPWCGLRSIDFSLRHPSGCLDGDAAAVTGEFWPPSPPLGIPLFDVRAQVVCAPPGAR